MTTDIDHDIYLDDYEYVLQQLNEFNTQGPNILSDTSTIKSQLSLLKAPTIKIV